MSQSGSPRKFTIEYDLNMFEMATKRTVFFKVFRGSMPFHLFMSFYENNGHDFLSREVLSYTSLVSF